MCLNSFLYLFALFCISVQSNIINYCKIQPNQHILCEKDFVVGPKCTGNVQKFPQTDNERLQTLMAINKFRSNLAVGQHKEKLSNTFALHGANILEVTWDAECEKAAANIVKYCGLNRNFLADRANIFSRFEAGFFFDIEESDTERKFRSLDGLIKYKLQSKDASYFNSFDNTTDLREGSLALTALAEVSVVGCAMMYHYLPGDKFNQFVSCVFGGITQWFPSELYQKGEPCSLCPQGSLCSSFYSGLCQCVDICYSLNATLSDELFSSNVFVRQIQEPGYENLEGPETSMDADQDNYAKMVERAINYCDIEPNRHYLCEENIEIGPTCIDQMKHIIKYPETMTDKVSSLNVLNEFRSKVANGNYNEGGTFAPEGANIFELEWDDELEKAAANIVKYCKFNPNFLTEKANIFYRFQTGLFYVSEPLNDAMKEFGAMYQFIEYLLNRTSGVSTTLGATSNYVTVESESSVSEIPISPQSDMDSVGGNAEILEPPAESGPNDANNTVKSLENNEVEVTNADGSSNETKEESNPVVAVEESGSDNETLKHGEGQDNAETMSDAKIESQMKSSEKDTTISREVNEKNINETKESAAEKRKRAAMLPEEFQPNISTEQAEQKTENQIGITTEKAELATRNKLDKATEQGEQETERQSGITTENTEQVTRNQLDISTVETEQRADDQLGKTTEETGQVTEKEIEIYSLTQSIPTQEPSQNKYSKAGEDKYAMLMMGEPSLVGCSMMIQNTPSVPFFYLACVLGGITELGSLYTKGKPCSQCPNDISVCSLYNPGLCKCAVHACQKLAPRLMTDVFLSNPKVLEQLTSLDKLYYRSNDLPTTMAAVSENEATVKSVNGNEHEGNAGPEDDDFVPVTFPITTSSASITTTTTMSSTTTSTTTTTTPKMTTTPTRSKSSTPARRIKTSPAPPPLVPAKSPITSGAEPRCSFKHLLMIVHVSLSSMVFLIILK